MLGENMYLVNMFNDIESLKNLKKTELKNLIKMGEELLKLKEFQKREIKNNILKGIKEGKRILAESQ